MRPHPIFARILTKHRPASSENLTQDGHNHLLLSGEQFFAKLGIANEKDQFIGEAESLKAMYTAAPGLVPKLLECGVIDNESDEHDADLGRPYFLSEYKDIDHLSNAAEGR